MGATLHYLGNRSLFTKCSLSPAIASWPLPWIHGYKINGYRELTALVRCVLEAFVCGWIPIWLFIWFYSALWRYHYLVRLNFDFCFVLNHLPRLTLKLPSALVGSILFWTNANSICWDKNQANINWKMVMLDSRTNCLSLCMFKVFIQLLCYP